MMDRVVHTHAQFIDDSFRVKMLAGITYKSSERQHCDQHGIFRSGASRFCIQSVVKLGLTCTAFNHTGIGAFGGASLGRHEKSELTMRCGHAVLLLAFLLFDGEATLFDDLQREETASLINRNIFDDADRQQAKKRLSAERSVVIDGNL
jgi:hypothetical protein